MKNGRIHIRLEEELGERIRQYAKKHGITLTLLVDRHFRKLLEEERAREEELKHDAEQI